MDGDETRRPAKSISIWQNKPTGEEYRRNRCGSSILLLVVRTMHVAS
jgi:hypothetical protein